MVENYVFPLARETIGDHATVTEYFFGLTSPGISVSAGIIGYSAKLRELGTMTGLWTGNPLMITNI